MHRRHPAPGGDSNRPADRSRGAAARRPSRCTPLSRTAAALPKMASPGPTVGPADRCLVAANLASFDSPGPEWKGRRRSAAGSWLARDWPAGVI